MASGKKFQVPFEQLIIFSTNLDPKDLVDDAFLRRIRHKVEDPRPDAGRVREDLHSYCKRLGMKPLPGGDRLPVRALLRSAAARPRASDCRDLLEIVQSICRYRRQPVHLTRDLIAEAATSFIAEFN